MLSREKWVRNCSQKWQYIWFRATHHEKWLRKQNKVRQALESKRQMLTSVSWIANASMIWDVPLHGWTSNRTFSLNPCIPTNSQVQKQIFSASEILHRPRGKCLFDRSSTSNSLNVWGLGGNKMMAATISVVIWFPEAKLWEKEGNFDSLALYGRLWQFSEMEWKIFKDINPRGPQCPKTFESSGQSGHFTKK